MLHVRFAAQRHRNMGPSGNAYLRELLLVRARLRQPQDRRHTVRRGRRVARNGSAVTYRIPDSSMKSFLGSLPLFFSFSIYLYYIRICVCIASAAGSLRRRRLRSTVAANEDQSQSQSYR